MRNMICILTLCISLGSAVTVRAEGDLLRINYADSYPPLSYGQHDSVKGVLPALMDAILVQKMGYTAVHTGKAWKRAQEEVWKGYADLLITSSTPERAQYSYQSRQPVFTLSFRPFTKVNSPASKALQTTLDISTLSQFRFCDVHGNQWGEQFYKKHNIDFHVTRSFETCLRLLSVGRTDIVVHSDHILSEIIKKNGWQDQIKPHPQVMAESPKFYLLLSKQSKYNRALLAEFDLTVERMRHDGSYHHLLRKLNIDYGVSVAAN
ncbi:hypothetical protein GCM10011332_12080 [Terasakiella brassicae]|uniref:Solute-binding protein family 3/N-terminal domain-containing protein n=1 Tax=Terasakiella brassicae TaxID=1634917 RepID=A0A917BVB4_9PROT|nr:transporter substrate-binding domain-containing protein [Terasakiella brassicae]GGF59990.1 hypothetical protein GCM10011332_12080 [Terasakiella brassicae]